MLCKSNCRWSLLKTLQQHLHKSHKVLAKINGCLHSGHLMLTGIARSVAYVYIDNATGKTMGVYHGSTLNHKRKLDRLQHQYDIEVDLYGNAYTQTIANLDYCKLEKHTDIPPFEIQRKIKPKVVKYTSPAPVYASEDALIVEICSKNIHTRVYALNSIFSRSDAVMEAVIQAMRMDEQGEIYRNNKKVRQDKAPSEKQLSKMTPVDRSFWIDKRGDGVIAALRTFSKFATREDFQTNMFTFQVLEKSPITMIRRETSRILSVFDEANVERLLKSRDLSQVLGCLEAVMESKSTAGIDERLSLAMSNNPAIRNVAYDGLKGLDLVSCKDAILTIVAANTFDSANAISKINIGKLFKNAGISYSDSEAKKIADNPKEDMGVRNAFGRLCV